ncbi:acyltransferase family protein [Thiotrichales bacterium 19S3-7]|nr:acyltransferase family protein [Thiotrichales bacterium 19S3-7]MCF6801874.1 acyltransferase family protein [Thiotrichales bacterium 19S3-11]
MERKRYHYLDNIKWVLAILVIIHHAAGAAGLDPVGFNLPQVITENQWQYDILSNLQGINQSFFMSLFFFISAYFSYPSLLKKGSSRFILDKLKRLGIPVLITVFIITPIVAYLGPKHASYIEVLTFYVSLLKFANMQLGVTWFCWTLIVFNLLFLIGHSLVTSKNQSQKTKQKQIPTIFLILLLATVMIIFNAIGLYLQNLLGEDFLGFHDLKYFPMYLVMFYLGVKAYQYQWLDQISFKHAFAGILMWLIAYAFLIKILSGYHLNGYVLSRGFTVFGLCLFIIYSFKVLFNTTNKMTEILARSSYAAYVIQVIPLVIFISILRLFMTEIPLVNFVIIAIPSVIFSFILGYIICKSPILKRIF